jgi:transcriptional regulator with XRE-family HTH domain
MAVAREPLAVVVGRNCERLRNLIGLTQDEFARYARDLGLRWKASAVGDFEAGRSAPRFATVVTVAIALQWALEESRPRDPEESGDYPGAISLADLMRFDGFVMLTDTFKVSGKFLVEACSGYVPTLESPMHDITKNQRVVVDFVADLLQRSGLAEQRQAKRMGIEPALLAALSSRLWQRTFSEERDRRAGPDANQQKRGQVTRAMQIELDEVLPRFTRRGGELADLATTKVWADGDR